jgi:DNA repair protein RadB
MEGRISTGTDVLDALLDGGYETDAITTIYGPAGAGKTNLAVLAAVRVTQDGKKVIYIDTEGGFSVARLKQIVSNPKKVLDKIVFLQPTTFEEQKKAFGRLKELVNSKIGLIIVDTIAMLYKIQRSTEDVKDVNQELGAQIGTLNEICRKHRIPVLMTNHVYSEFGTGRLNLVGGDILKYGSKCLLELQPLAQGKRKIVLRKHRSIAGEKEAFFQIVEDGIAGA